MNVIVASKNPVKVQAARNAFAEQYPDSDLNLTSVSVASGVSDQPMTDDETRLGARTRATNAQAARPSADFWVGLEGGIEVMDGTLLTFAWMSIRSHSGSHTEARTATLPLPPAIKELVEAGFELGEANDRVFATLNSKHGGGAYGLLTQGRLTRESIYTQTLAIALMPFASPLYPQQP